MMVNDRITVLISSRRFKGAYKTMKLKKLAKAAIQVNQNIDNPVLFIMQQATESQDTFADYEEFYETQQFLFFYTQTAEETLAIISSVTLGSKNN